MAVQPGFYRTWSKTPKTGFLRTRLKSCLQIFEKKFQYKQLLCYFEMANTVDPDEIAHYEPSNLDLQCLQIQLLLCLALYGLKAVAGLILNS